MVKLSLSGYPLRSAVTAAVTAMRRSTVAEMRHRTIAGLRRSAATDARRGAVAGTGHGVGAVSRAEAPWSLTDAVIAAVVTGMSLAFSSAAASWHGQPVSPVGYLLLTVGGASLAARRRYPGITLGVTLLAALLSAPLGNARTGWLPVIVAFFAAVRARRRAAVIGSLVIGYLVAVWPPWLIGSRGHSATFALSLLCGLLALLSIAELTRAATQRRLAAQSIRQQERMRLASEERMRIARDLHDVVAHNISVINVQASTALHLADRQPERAVQALSVISDVSSQALAELRSVLGVLRAYGDAAPRAPTPGLGQLETLIGNMAAAGLKVDLETEGDPAPLPASTDLAAYRIIQEALTNSARHSGASRATVWVRYTGSDVEIEVGDEGTAGPKPPRPAGTAGGNARGGGKSVGASGESTKNGGGNARTASGDTGADGYTGSGGGDTGAGGGYIGSGGKSVGTGSGIAGMTDRAQALGGRLTAGPRPGGGYRVTALLPIGDGSSGGGSGRSGNRHGSSGGHEGSTGDGGGR